MENFFLLITKALAAGTMDAWLPVGLFVAGGLLALWAMCVVVALSFDYVTDDEDYNKTSKLFIHFDFSWEVERGFIIFLSSMMMLAALVVSSVMVLPTLFFLLAEAIWLPVLIASTYTTLRLVRAVVRLKNKLSLHMADLSAHTSKGE